MKHLFQPIFYGILTIIVICCGFLSPSASAQTITHYQVIITDDNGGQVTKIDTLIPASMSVDALVRSLGYDQASIENSPDTKSGRKVAVNTKEIVDLPAFAKKGRELDVGYFFDIPEDAVIEDIPGGKKITTTTIDEFGNVQTKESIVRRGEREYFDGQKEATWHEVDALPIGSPGTKTTTKETYRAPGRDGMPDAKITIATADPFDNSTINSRDHSLINAAPLEVNDFLVRPDYDEGYFKFTFNVVEPGDTKLRVFDVIGVEVYTETLTDFDGKYNKRIPYFNIYRKGPFIILLTQEGKKFLQKVIID